MTMKNLLTQLQLLHNGMEQLSGNEMGHLTYAEAALFHNATALIGDLIESLDERAVAEEDDYAARAEWKARR